MNYTIYQVDAFSREPFGGNPAAIIPLDDWPEDELLQSIALENNLSETAFIVPKNNDFELRWFTPAVEVDLCGHATLASAHVLFEHLAYTGDSMRFHTRSGVLEVFRQDSGYTLDFPAYALADGTVDMAICDALGALASEVKQVHGAQKLLYVFEFEEDVAGLAPDFAALLAAGKECIIATAPGDNCDFVSRFFGPQVGINEDPVTGSAHCALVPYWSQRLGLERMEARQISARGGDLSCELTAGRVRMTGEAVTFMQGKIHIPD
ncbi:MAG: PhzF family phenazine biosynthesis protein [Halioglobus sp.]